MNSSYKQINSGIKMVKKGNVSHSFKQKNAKNRETKTSITFDEQARTEYLTGFSKRKKMRQKKAQEMMAAEMKEAKRKIKQKNRAALLSRLDQFKDVTKNWDDLVSPQEIDLPSQTVTITDVTDVDFVGSGGLRLGTNEVKDEESEPETKEKKTTDDDDEDSEEEQPARSDDNLQQRNKRKWKPPNKRHQNYMHMRHKKKPRSREEHQRMKRKQHRKQRNQPA